MLTRINDEIFRKCDYKHATKSIQISDIHKGNAVIMRFNDVNYLRLTRGRVRNTYCLHKHINDLQTYIIGVRFSGSLISLSINVLI